MRVIYSHLLTEAGLDLLTEAGEALDLALVGYAGDLTVTGGMDSALLTEAGLDLLTESGDALTGGRQNGGTAAAFGRVVLRGTCAVAGQAGTVAGTGRVIRITPPVIEPPAVHFIRAPAALRGRCAVHGQPGSAAGIGHLTLVGKGAATGIPGSATGAGHLTLVGTATFTAPPARLSGRGDVIDELALILALAA